MDQLPYVDSGSVLADLLPGVHATDHPLRDNFVVLGRSHRSEAGILEVARRINAMDGAGALEFMGEPLARLLGWTSTIGTPMRRLSAN